MAAISADDVTIFYARKSPFSGELDRAEEWCNSLDQLQSAATYNHSHTPQDPQEECHLRGLDT